ncbi:lytic transglycosylase domain-containing protein [Microvirga pudoricolor]|uniref:lytic transglycosylase domain-containing protein n=1 Tax=Microvirga pudoricolor TaxID=2778729 RepID=UPI00194E545F|nr:lytic transglycosylase domain-containing protein [Microvirga pudoricolor]MBM6595888.1 lytic transglycosylase domain-containing protein [Microvirga pudoricolor]
MKLRSDEAPAEAVEDAKPSRAKGKSAARVEAGSDETAGDTKAKAAKKPKDGPQTTAAKPSKDRSEDAGAEGSSLSQAERTDEVASTEDERPSSAKGAKIAAAAAATGLQVLVQRYASQNNIPYPLADAIIRIESRYNAGARNGPHMGLTQIHTATARSLGYTGEAAGLLDAETNLRYGLKYLATAYKLAGGDTCGTILRYQAGHRAETMTAAARKYCARVKIITAGAE